MAEWKSSTFVMCRGNSHRRFESFLRLHRRKDVETCGLGGDVRCRRIVLGGSNMGGNVPILTDILNEVEKRTKGLEGLSVELSTEGVERGELKWEEMSGDSRLFVGGSLVAVIRKSSDKNELDKKAIDIRTKINGVLEGVWEEAKAEGLVVCGPFDLEDLIERVQDTILIQ